MDPQSSGIAAPPSGGVVRQRLGVPPSEDRSNPNYFTDGHRGYCWTGGFVAATIRLGADAPAEERAALATQMLESGEMACECHLPPPGNRPLVW